MTTYKTGNPLGSAAAKDLYDNSENLDHLTNDMTNEAWQDRLGNNRKTWYGIEKNANQAIKNYGYIRLKSFQLGAPLPENKLTLPNQVLFDESSGEYYRWDGLLPKAVPSGSTPASTGGEGVGKWLSVGDAVLRGQLAADGGVTLVKNAVDDRGDTMTGGLRIATTYGELIVGDQPLPVADSARDAINVARKLDNSPTNCHGFADKTWINQASDYGGYGAFDATVLVSGTNTHNHVYSFQDRTNYSGSGTLQNMEGFYSSPTITGTGTVDSRMGVFINNAAVSGGGKLLQQNGLFIEDLFSATTNVAIHVRQTQGLGYYAPNFGKMYQNGVAGFGIDPTTLANAINFRGGGEGSFYGFLTTDPNGTYLGTTGDTGLKFVSGNEVRLQIKKAAGEQRAVTPGTDNSAPLGDAVTRWSTVFAGTGTINTSDGREKSAPVTAEALSSKMADDADAILDAWGEVSIIAFQWLSAIKEKGEEDARWHFGVIAQQVRDAFHEKGIDATRFGLICHDVWDDQYDVEPEEVVQHPAEFSGLLDESLKPVIKKEAWTEVVKTQSRVLRAKAGDRWGIRADQCLWLEAAYQRRERRNLEGRIKALEELILKK